VSHPYSSIVIMPCHTPQLRFVYSFGGLSSVILKGGMDVSHPRKALIEDQQQQSHHQIVGMRNNYQMQQQQVNCNNNMNNSNLGLTATLLNPLRERLTAIEELTRDLQTQQGNVVKTEFGHCLSELRLEISKAVEIHGAMKSEVDKLQARMVSLENHNKAMTTIIIPTLVCKIYVCLNSLRICSQRR
jgi:hypothetical protein